jgi:hypothetical protein
LRAQARPVAVSSGVLRKACAVPQALCREGVR